ncbi:MAG: thrombospondin type 3 repeat-containing protein [Chloroflexi bacterium]|nr:thrombospondin type 3 repeat-containing protein [Chloroflexota bacterium]
MFWIGTVGVLAIVVLSGFLAARSGLAFDTPTSGLYVKLDCDPGTQGVQETCNFLTGTAGVDVAIVVLNVNVPGVNVNGFELAVQTNQQATFDPPSGTLDGTNGNPDLDEQSLGPSWQCGSALGDVNPNSDVAESYMYCWDPSSPGVALPAGGSLRLATVHYEVLAPNATGVFTPTRLTLAVDQGGGASVLAVGICDPRIEHYGPCSPATVNIAAATQTATPCDGACPTDTPTPTATATRTPEPTPSSSSCSGVNPSQFAPLADGAITQMLFDRWCQHVFALNPSKNRIDVLSLASGAFEAPIPVGVDPRGFDFSPDGLLLYVADAGSGDIRVYDTLSQMEVRRINVPMVEPCGGVPMSLATSINGLVFFTVGTDGCSSGNMMQLDPSTDLITERVDFHFGSHGMQLARSRDHSVLVVSTDNVISRYSAGTDLWDDPYVDLGALAFDLDDTGANIFVNHYYESYLLDGAFNLNATMGGHSCCSAVDAGAAINGSGTAGYHVTSSGLEVLDLTTYLPQGVITLGDSVSNGNYPLGRPWRVRLSPDDTLAAVITDHGINIVAIPPQPQPIPPHVIAPSPTPATSGCSSGLAPLTFAAIEGAPLHAVAIDRWCERAYATNTRMNRVEVLNLRTGLLEAPIQVGSRPKGLDLSLDPGLMYVASGGGNYVSVVDLGGRAELERVYLLSPYTNASELSIPSSVQQAASGVVLVGGARRMISYNPSTRQTRVRDDFGFFGQADPQLAMAGSAARDVIGISNRVLNHALLYTSATDSFSPGTNVGYFASAIAHNDATGGWLLSSATGRTELRDSSFSLVTSTNVVGSAVAVSPGGSLAYLAGGSAIDVLDIPSLTLRGQLSTGDPGGHALVRSVDGKILIAATDHGLSLLRIDAIEPTPPAPTATFTATVTQGPPNTPTPTATLTPTDTPNPLTPTAAATPRALPTSEYFVALDCGNGPGVDCDVYAGSGPIDVAVKFGNPVALGGTVGVPAFNFDVYNPNSAVLGVGVGVPTRNPAFVRMTSCDSPPADDDTGWFGAGATDSFLSCISLLGLPGDPMPSGGITTLGTVHYNVAAGGGPVAVPLTLYAVAVVDDGIQQIVTCDAENLPFPAPTPPIVLSTQCINVTINVIVPPTPTPTATPTNTPIPDIDGDGVADGSDNCMSIANPAQANRNAEIIPLPKPLPPFDDTTNIIGDNAGDACETDIDHDGVANTTETGLGLSPYIADTDGDRTNDGTEIACGSDPLNTLSKLTGTDADHDSVPDACEAIYGTDPNNVDSDGDRLLDGWEVRYWMSNPLARNTDGDSCTDEREVASVNNDAKVNSTDMLMLAQRFGSVVPEWGDLDMNGDGKINSTDMLFVSQHFGQCRAV